MSSSAQKKISTSPSRNSARKRISELPSFADIEIDGSRPWDVRVNDPRFFRIAFDGSLAIGEAYMDGVWECDQLDEMIFRSRRANLEEKFQIGSDVLEDNQH